MTYSHYRLILGDYSASRYQKATRRVTRTSSKTQNSDSATVSPTKAPERSQSKTSPAKTPSKATVQHQPASQPGSGKKITKLAPAHSVKEPEASPSVYTICSFYDSCSLFVSQQVKEERHFGNVTRRVAVCDVPHCMIPDVFKISLTAFRARRSRCLTIIKVRMVSGLRLARRSEMVS